MLIRSIRYFPKLLTWHKACFVSVMTWSGGYLKKQFDILIADKNPHVREFLKREMTDAGYRVHLAVNGTQVLTCASRYPIDILIADPDLPDSDSLSLLKQLRDHLPHIHVIIHTFISDYADHSGIFNSAVWVEKGESSVERLKEVVAQLRLPADIKKETA